MKKTNQKKPLVSVILPVFKSERYLETCLKSLSAQSFKNFEIVAVVDYLGDKSLKILKKYKKIEPRLRVYSNLQRYGLAATLNRAVGLSKGQYIAFMDSSGIAKKTRISKQIKYLLKDPEIGAVGTQINLIGAKNRKLSESSFPLEHEEIYKHLIAAGSMKFETVTLNKTRLPKDILKFKKENPYPFIYVDVLLRIAQYKKIVNINEKLVSIREISKHQKQVINVRKQFSLLKMLFESNTNYSYKPSLKSLFSPILRQN